MFSIGSIFIVINGPVFSAAGGVRLPLCAQCCFRRYGDHRSEEAVRALMRGVLACVLRIFLSTTLTARKDQTTRLGTGVRAGLVKREQPRQSATELCLVQFPLTSYAALGKLLSQCESPCLTC